MMNVKELVNLMRLFSLKQVCDIKLTASSSEVYLRRFQTSAKEPFYESSLRDKNRQLFL